MPQHLFVTKEVLFESWLQQVGEGVPPGKHFLLSFLIAYAFLTIASLGNKPPGKQLKRDAMVIATKIMRLPFEALVALLAFVGRLMFIVYVLN